MSNPIFNFIFSLFRIEQTQLKQAQELQEHTKHLHQDDLAIKTLQHSITSLEQEILSLLLTLKSNTEDIKLLADVVSKSLAQQTQPFYVIPVSRVKSLVTPEETKEDEQE